VLDDLGRVLVVRERKAPRRFGFPGGRVEPGESPATAAVRECAEETGLEVSVSYLVGRYHYVDGLVFFVFRCALTGSREPRAERGSVVGWWEPDRVPSPIRGSFHYALPDVRAGNQNVRRVGLRPLSHHLDSARGAH
jgi:8-oxo-dGTP pyrophosphatase MutT (NUDIX family)